MSEVRTAIGDFRPEAAERTGARRRRLRDPLDALLEGAEETSFDALLRALAGRDAGAVAVAAAALEGWPDARREAPPWLDWRAPDPRWSLVRVARVQARDRDDVEAFARATHLAADLRLGVVDVALGEDGAAAVARGPLARATSIGLSGCAIGDRGAERLAAALGAPVWLDVSRNHLGDRGATALAAAPHPRVAKVNLHGNDVRDAGALAWAARPPIRCLYLGDNRVGHAGQDALLAAGYHAPASAGGRPVVHLHDQRI